MLHKLIDHNQDLKKLHDEGYEIEIRGAYLMVHSIPYVNSKKEVSLGVIVSELNLAGDETAKPKDHTVHFIGEHPHDREGKILAGIKNASEIKDLGSGIVINHTFSNKPQNGYGDHYQKITTYIKIISAHAESLNPDATAKVFKEIEAGDDDSPFNYVDTNSGKAEIDAISAKLRNFKIAIVGVGGTGSYILDFIAKTPVKEIHLFDGDTFLSHNAFRAPGAAPIEKLREQQKKVTYLHEAYSKMHRYIIPHDYHITSAVLEELSSMDFVFICIDKAEAKKLIIEKLISGKIPFIDVGIGVNLIEGLLNGSVRVTTSTAGKNDHIPTRVSLSDKGNDDIYAKNIQIAEINALNAALAIIKWKKIFGYYHDITKEHNTIYNIDVNSLINEDEVIS